MSLRLGPHYEISSVDLGAWIEKQGPKNYWTVENEVVLAYKMFFPAPGGQLAEMLRRLNRPILVQDPRARPDATGQVIGEADLDSVARLWEEVRTYRGERPIWADDRVFLFCWKDSDREWLLVEDRGTTRRYELDELEFANRAIK